MYMARSSTAFSPRRGIIFQLRLIALLLVAAGVALSAQPIGSALLEIYVIDVEGGEATLFVSPTGESMLVDAGWPGYSGRDAARIVAAANEAGVTAIDYLLVTHFHTDHMGGSLPLAARLPIHHFVAHGSWESVDSQPSTDMPTCAHALSISRLSQVIPSRLLVLMSELLHQGGKFYPHHFLVPETPIPRAITFCFTVRTLRAEVVTQKTSYP